MPPHDHARPGRHDPYPGFPVDPDVTGEADLAPVRRGVVAAMAIGGALGAATRWGVEQALPYDAGRFPWATAITNVLGCFLIGVLMVLVIERIPDRPLVRPFLGTGFLGGFTTFSTYAVDTRTLLAHDHLAAAAAYSVGSLVLGLLAVVVALRLTERVVR